MTIQGEYGGSEEKTTITFVAYNLEILREK